MIVLTLPPIPAAEARRLFAVDLTTGVLTWAVAHGRWRELPAGGAVGCIRSNGYRYVTIRGRNVFAHQIAWLISRGEWPPMTIDHINGNRDDNRPENLRLATLAENNQNQHGTPAHNTSGCRGVSWDSARCRWTAHISVHGKSRNLGRFDAREAAEAAYRAAKREFHPFSSEAAS